MTVEMFSWPSLHERMCQTWGLNSGPLACQGNTLPIELPRPVSGYMAFPYIMHLSTLVTLFCCFTKFFFVPYIILCTARLSLFHTGTLFLPLNYIVYKYYSCFRQRRGHFFHRHTCIQWLHGFSLYSAFVYTCLFVSYIILCTAVSDKERVILFSLSHLYTVVTWLFPI